jgi:cell division protein FtsI (penicillin-binding protein 3)
MFEIEKRKIKFTFLFFVIAFVLILLRAIKIQLIDRDMLNSYSQRQFFKESKVFPKRGTIFDRNGNPLAINIQTFSIFAIPKNNKLQFDSYKKLTKIVPQLKYNKIKNKIIKRRKYTWLARKIKLEKSQVEAIRKLEGIYIEAVPKRYYPNKKLLSQVLGFVGVDNVGLSGIEYSQDKILKGSPKVVKYLKDAKGRAIKYESLEVGDGPENIILSIDKDLQYILEKNLKEAVVKHDASLGGAGVMDVKTGEILAMANYPTFDSNNFKKYNSQSRKLSFITDPFEPGSIFKTLTVAAALEHHSATPETSYYCERGKFKVEDHFIKEADASEKFEWLTVSEILRYSSNIGTTKIAFDLTYPKLKQTLKKFQIGEKTNIELMGESRGIYTEKKNVSPLKLSNMSFGQGVATTALQMLSSYAVIANKGLYLPPTIIKDQNKHYTPQRVLSQSTAEHIEKMLVDVVDKGTGSNARIPHFKIAAKTSTAQKVDYAGGYKGHIPGLIGYPVNVDDRFVVFVYIDNPKGKSYYGNTVAGPVFKKITQYLLYKSKKYQNLIKMPTDSLDKVKYRQASSRIKAINSVPNFIGLDKKSVLKLRRKLGVHVDSSGAGLVFEQWPREGTIITPDMSIKLMYEPPIYD